MKTWMKWLSVGVMVLALGYWAFHQFYLRVDLEAINNLNNGNIELVGHAGLGFSSITNPYPDNSWPALMKAWYDFHPRGLEVDVQLSKDLQLVLYHDQFLNSKTDLEGCIEDYSLAELQATSYHTNWLPHWWTREPPAIVSLEDLLIHFDSATVKPTLHLDFHSHSYCNGSYERDSLHAQALAKLASVYPWSRDSIRAISTHLPLLLFIRKEDPGIHLTYEETWSFEDGMDRITENGLNSMCIKPRILTPEKTAIAHAAGIEVMVFGAGDKYGAKELIELNPDVIHADNLEAVQTLLNR